MDKLITFVGGAVALIFVIWLLVKITKKIKPMSEQESRQYEIDKMAAGSDKERAYGLGKSARDSAKKGGCSGWFWILLIVVAAIVWILSNLKLS